MKSFLDIIWMKEEFKLLLSAYDADGLPIKYTDPLFIVRWGIREMDVRRQKGHRFEALIPKALRQ